VLTVRDDELAVGDDASSEVAEKRARAGELRKRMWMGSSSNPASRLQFTGILATGGTER